ncbi:MAG: helix-hairpin-helix domain-containing protein [Caldicoprobacterales bacterium]
MLRHPINVVRENPYRLAEDIIGIGFKTADRIARSMGVDPNSPYRAAAGIKYVLSNAASEGPHLSYQGGAAEQGRKSADRRRLSS